MGDGAPGEGGLDRFIDRIGSVARSHNTLVIGCHIDE
jgi:hypothetical protein